ncbi:hypothetical protein, variant 1 [Aphanomyces invadans]|uniref:Bromo domain-containing protein n=1 Tax=Aphanomyces invadans TaxID=157072 RepID=A0A024TG06_9STRA|nr:hypothetical protein, variant 1 [Aphanomyces invadans]ETV92526.1 hypothetical protein, variant 1 [Aphanomyces invadans]|eukprot:XP_008878833.1 hypothetical protein, variant 1 [Aphanomyces invadans]
MARMLPSRRSISSKEPKEFLQDVMTQTLAALQKKDVYELFARPVDVRAVPDYLDKVLTPMDFSTIQEKVSRRQYASFDEFKVDVVVVFNNAQNYNMEHTVYFREATKLAQIANVLFHDADIALDANKRQYRAYSSTTSSSTTKKQNNLCTIVDESASNAPDTEMEMVPPTFDLGIFQPADPLPPQQDDYLADNDKDGDELFHDMDLDGYHTDDSYVFDAVIHDPEHDPHDDAIAANALQGVDDVSDIDSDDSSLSDGIDFMDDFATRSGARVEATAPPLQCHGPPDKENIVPTVSTTKQARHRQDNSGWIPRKRTTASVALSQPGKRLSPSSSSAPKKTPYKSIFGLHQPLPPRSRQALMDVFVVHPTTDSS